MLKIIRGKWLDYEEFEDFLRDNYRPEGPRLLAKKELELIGRLRSDLGMGLYMLLNDAYDIMHEIDGEAGVDLLLSNLKNAPKGKRRRANQNVSYVFVLERFEGDIDTVEDLQERINGYDIKIVEVTEEFGYPVIEVETTIAELRRFLEEDFNWDDEYILDEISSVEIKK